MTLKTSTPIALVAVITLIGCGGTSKASTTQKVTASAGATLTAGAATLTIPAGALTKDTQVTLREAEPHHAGRVTRVEVEPHDALAAGHEAHLSVKVSDSNPKVKMHSGSDDSLEDVEVDDRNHHSFKTNTTTLGDWRCDLRGHLRGRPGVRRRRVRGAQRCSEDLRGGLRHRPGVRRRDLQDSRRVRDGARWYPRHLLADLRDRPRVPRRPLLGARVEAAQSGRRSDVCAPARGGPPGTRLAFFGGAVPGGRGAVPDKNLPMNQRFEQSNSAGR